MIRTIRCRLSGPRTRPAVKRTPEDPELFLLYHNPLTRVNPPLSLRSIPEGVWGVCYACTKAFLATSVAVFVETLAAKTSKWPVVAYAYKTGLLRAVGRLGFS
jgi:hypothetical protein